MDRPPDDMARVPVRSDGLDAVHDGDGPRSAGSAGSCSIGTEHRLVRRTDFFDLPRRIGARRHRVGVLADYLGRKRTLMITILIYAASTGLAGSAGSWWELGAYRFHGPRCGRRVGAGGAILAETWPEKARAKGCGDPSDVGRHGRLRRGAHLSVRWRLRLAPRVSGRRAPRGAPFLHTQDHP